MIASVFKFLPVHYTHLMDAVNMVHYQLCINKHLTHFVGILEVFFTVWAYKNLQEERQKGRKEGRKKGRKKGRKVGR